MQTFLPYPNFKRSVQCLDNKRLGKQRVEAWQILNTLTGKSHGWKNHPAVKMWRGYETALIGYYHCCLDEWAARGFKNEKLKPIIYPLLMDVPKWFGNRDFHRSHQSNLVRKDPHHYRFDVPNNLPYVWPV
jgi:hypothetical protein